MIFKRFFSCFAIFLLLFFAKEFIFERWYNIHWLKNIVMPSFVFGVITSYFLPYVKKIFKNKNITAVNFKQIIIEKKKILIKIIILSFAVVLIIFLCLYIKNYLKQKERERLFIQQKEERILTAKQNFKTEAKNLVSKFLNEELGFKYGSCWEHKYNQVSFCTKINNINIFNDAPTKAYVSLVSENLINTSHVDTGLLRFLIFELDFIYDGRPFFKKIADSKFFKNGKFGTSAYTKLNYVKLGKDFYGWEVNDYDTGQGWSFGEKILYVPHFTNTSEQNEQPVKIKPAISFNEFGFDGNSYSTDFSVEAIIKTNPDESKKYYDLEVVYKQIKGEEKQPDKVFSQIEFDESTGLYSGRKRKKIKEAEELFYSDYVKNYNPNRNYK